MNTSAAGVTLTLCLTASIHADIIGTLTADNHYALYGERNNEIYTVGGNETGVYGSSGRYNWSVAESFSFDTDAHIFIAAWSDDRVAQGLLAQFQTDKGMLSTGQAGWEVMSTGIDLDDGSPYPTASLIAQQVDLADTLNLWQTPAVGQNNTSATRPWGKIANINDDAKWTWIGAEGKETITQGGNFGEFLIFRNTIVPAPGTLTLAVCGMGAWIRPRRH